MSFHIADLFCGAGGTSTGAIEAVTMLGHTPRLTAVNHWPVAIATHTLNHPAHRHFCATIDQLNPRELFRDGELDLLWASPECTHHSTARGGKPINDQSRASAWCVARWAEALLPSTIMVENVPEFATWGPIGSNGRPLASRKGETFQAWLRCLESLGYTVEHRTFCAADYGDPTTRTRLFVQAQRGRRRIVWPDATHAEITGGDLFACKRRPWVSAAEIIDWSLPLPSIFDRKKPLADNTLARIFKGLKAHGGATIIAMEHGGRSLSTARPLPTVTTAKGGAFGVAYILPQQSCGKLRPVTKPMPTVATAGALALIVEYYGNGVARPVTEPLPTVTCRDRFALIRQQGGDIGFRMLRWNELAAAQGFRSDYQFTGNVQDKTKQIGNAVPRNLARALVLAAIGQVTDVAGIIEPTLKAV